MKTVLFSIDFVRKLSVHLRVL